MAIRGADHPVTLQSLHGLASIYARAERLDRSIPLFEECHKLREAKFGRRHFVTILTAGSLGVNYKRAGRLDDAAPLLEESYWGLTEDDDNRRWIGFVRAGPVVGYLAFEMCLSRFLQVTQHDQTECLLLLRLFFSDFLCPT